MRFAGSSLREHSEGTGILFFLAVALLSIFFQACRILVSQCDSFGNAKYQVTLSHAADCGYTNCFYSQIMTLICLFEC